MPIINFPQNPIIYVIISWVVVYFVFSSFNKNIKKNKNKYSKNMIFGTSTIIAALVWGLMANYYNKSCENIYGNLHKSVNIGKGLCMPNINDLPEIFIKIGE